MTSRPEKLPIFGACLLLALGFFWFGFTGYNGTDDRSYLRAAENWLSSGVYVGDTHWALRHALVLPLAASLKAFGGNEFAFILPSILYFAALAATFAWVVYRLFGPWQSAAFLALFPSTPLFAVFGSTTFVDLVEMMYCAFCLLLFYFATRTGRTACFALSGVALGLAFEARETSIALVPFFGLLFLIGWRASRRSYLVLFLLAGLIVGLEAAFYVAHGLSPLYRLETMERTHASLSNIASVTEYRAGSGSLSNDRLLGPLISLLVNQEFAFLFWISPIFAFALFTRIALTPRQRDFLALFSSAGVAWFLLVGFSGMVEPWPRYFHLLAFVAVLLNAIGIGFLLAQGRRLVALCAFSALLAGNALGLLVENTDNRYAERALARYLAETDETVYTDPRTQGFGFWLLKWRDDAFPERVIVARPPPGALFFENPDALEHARTARVGRPDHLKYEPDPDWPVVWRFAKPRRAAYAIVEELGLASRLPASIVDKLTDPEVRVRRVPREGG